MFGDVLGPIVTSRDAAKTPVHYVSQDEDSGRWAGFKFRPGDIVISTRSKSGTTWMQRICSLLVFRSAELPAPIAELSPWLDHLVTPVEQVYATLEAQTHRRFIKTHTPLDGVPLRPRSRTSSYVGSHWTPQCPCTTRATTSIATSCAGFPVSLNLLSRPHPGRRCTTGSLLGWAEFDAAGGSRLDPRLFLAPP